jgi:hypothetical protein
MDLQQLQALSDAQKARYMALGKLFEHPSYKFLMDWAQAMVNEALLREINATTWDLVLLNRGARLAFQDIVNLETATENEFAGYADQALQEKADEEDVHTRIDDI